MTDDRTIIAYVLADSDRADRELALRLEAWRDGWRAACQHLGDRYEEGFADGLLYRKQLEHATVAELRGELARWDGRREDFGKPRPGDIQPRTRQAGAA